MTITLMATLAFMASVVSTNVRTVCRERPGASVVRSLDIAIRGYKIEYLQLPRVASSDAIFIESRGTLLAVLLAESTAENSRQIRFWDPPRYEAWSRAGATKTRQGEWELRDPWGRFYRVQLDVDQDGVIPNPAKGARKNEPDVLHSDVIIYSAGQDGDYTTWKDNVLSWQ